MAILHIDLLQLAIVWMIYLMLRLKFGKKTIYNVQSKTICIRLSELKISVRLYFLGNKISDPEMATLLGEGGIPPPVPP